jgi:dTDP-4-dehydrorhamnose 3,5-epimerase
MKVTETAIPDVKLIQPRRHADQRGWMAEVWSQAGLRTAGIVAEFVQENLAYSANAATLRGLHYQAPPAAQGKLVQVMRGAIYDVAVDLRRGSPHFGKHVAVQLDSVDQFQLWIPSGFAHGYQTIQDGTEVLYRLTAPYAPACEHGVRWNDPALAIAWPQNANLTVNDRDRLLPVLHEVPAHFRYGDA